MLQFGYFTHFLSENSLSNNYLTTALITLTICQANWYTTTSGSAPLFFSLNLSTSTPNFSITMNLYLAAPTSWDPDPRYAGIPNLFNLCFCLKASTENKSYSFETTINPPTVGLFGILHVEMHLDEKRSVAVGLHFYHKRIFRRTF
jgi:hypothetical protein